MLQMKTYFKIEVESASVLINSAFCHSITGLGIKQQNQMATVYVVPFITSGN
jgi:hypothetical protein